MRGSVTEPRVPHRSLRWPESLPSCRADASGAFVTLSDGVTHFEDTGPDNARVAVLGHGSSVPYYVWDSTTVALRNAGYRVIRYDLFGRCLSDRPDVEYDGALNDRQLSELLVWLQRGSKRVLDPGVLDVAQRMWQVNVARDGQPFPGAAIASLAALLRQVEWTRRTGHVPYHRFISGRIVRTYSLSSIISCHCALTPSSPASPARASRACSATTTSMSCVSRGSAYKIAATPPATIHSMPHAASGGANNDTTSVGRTTEKLTRHSRHSGVVKLRLAKPETGGDRVPRQVPDGMGARQLLVRRHSAVALGLWRLHAHSA